MPTESYEPEDNGNSLQTSSSFEELSPHKTTWKVRALPKLFYHYTQITIQTFCLRVLPSLVKEYANSTYVIIKRAFWTVDSCRQLLS